MGKTHVVLCCSLDVEEEGLFRGSYAIASPPVTNLAHLERLHPLLDMGVRPTLFCAHAVADSDTAWAHVERLACAWPVEVGAHLHHWNTPPLADAGAGCTHAVPSALVDDRLLEDKLGRLVERLEHRTGSRPTSFRMGRWDLHARHWPILARAGILADASVRPLHRGNAKNLAADHFDAPATPYLVRTRGRTIFELPLTVTPLSPLLLRLLPEGARPSFQHWGALALLPVYHPLWAMKAVTRLSVARGNPILSLTWHSSELMPGGNPKMPTPAAIDRFVRKIRDYLAWLADTYDVRFATLEEVRRHWLPRCAPAPAAAGDWTCRADSPVPERHP